MRKSVGLFYNVLAEIMQDRCGRGWLPARGHGVGAGIFAVACVALYLGHVGSAAAATYWLDNHYDLSRPHYRTPAEACYLGQFEPQIRSMRSSETNPSVRFRVAAMYIGPDQGLGERVCRGVIEKTYAGNWVTAYLIDTLVYGPIGSTDACHLSGYTDPDTGQCGPPKCTDTCCGSGCGNGSDPIQTASGNLHEGETDFVGSGPFPLRFQRTYNSKRIYDNNPVPMGAGWSHSYSGRIIGLGTTGGGVNTAVVERPDGRVLKYTLSGGSWHTDPDVSERLEWSADGSGTPLSWRFITDDDTVETYDAEGRLVSLTNRAGLKQTLSYTDANGHPVDQVQEVTGPLGRSLTFAYNTGGQLTSVTDGNGNIIAYAYQNGNLYTATYPDAGGGTNVRTYHFNETGQTAGANLPHALTGITDENNDRYASWGYTNYGWANLSVHGPFTGGTINRTAFTYNTNGTTTITDGLGQSRTFTFQVKYFVARYTGLDTPCDYCGTKFTSRSYDTNGYPSGGTDFRGVQTQATYNARGLQTVSEEAVGMPEERTTNTTWSSTFRVPTRHTVVNHNSITEQRTDWAYNARGQAIARCQYNLAVVGAGSYVCAATGTPPAGIRRWVYNYCDAVNLSLPDPIGSPGENIAKGCPLIGLIRRVDGPRTDVNDWTTYEYYLADDSGATPAWRKGDLKAVTDALGHATDYLSYDGNGRILRRRDANGVITDLTWHPRGWLLTRTVRANANGAPSAGDATTTMTYDAVGNLVQVQQADGVTMSYGYDNAHRLTSITDALGNHIDFTLDALGNRTSEKTFAVGNPTTPTRMLTRSFNTLSRLTDQYDAQNRDTTFAWDGNGNRTDRTDPLGVQTHWSYDGLNRLVAQVRDYQGSEPDTANATTDYQYDTRNNVTQVTDPNNLATSYAFDDLNDLTQLSSPDTGITGYPSYDAAGNRLTQTDARGVTSTYVYDALNRLTAVSYPTSTEDLMFRYDSYAGASPCAVTSFPVGRLTQFSDASGHTTFCYDLRGNVTEKIQVTGNYRFDTRYQWNLANRLLGITYPSGATVSYSRDAVGRIDAVSVTPSGGTATSVLTSITWLPFGPPTTFAFATGGQTLTKNYDQNYWITDITSNVLDLHFCRDAMRNITALTPTAGTCPPAAPLESYDYDALYRLTGVNDTSGNPLQTFTYNLTGDRTSKAIGVQAPAPYGYQLGTHHLTAVGSNARQLDASGNTTEITGAATQDFIYNDRNRLSAVDRNSTQIADYEYNARGERVYKTTAYPTNDNRWFNYAGDGRLLGEYTTTTAQEYIWVNQVPVALLTTAGQALSIADQIFANGFDPAPTLSTSLYYIHTDQLNTPRAATTTAGVQVWAWPWQNNPFGEAPATGSITLNLRFPGQYHDSETGFNYNYYRDYEPAVGRYIQSDPIGLIGGTASYSYVAGAPLLSSDTFGFFEDPPEKPDYSACSYYTAMYSHTHCCYYKIAGSVCNDRNRLVKTWVHILHVGNTKLNCVRSCLVKEDKKALHECGCRPGYRVCVSPECIDKYHRKCYARCGAPKFAYGGTIIPLSTYSRVLQGCQL